MLSPHMLKSTGLSRRPTMSPERRKKDESRQKNRQTRSGSLMVYLEEDLLDGPLALAMHSRNSSIGDYETNEDEGGFGIPIPRRGRTPSPNVLALSVSPRNSIATIGSFKETSNEMKESKEAKLQRRKTSTATSLMRKLKIQKKSSPPLEKDGCKIEVSPGSSHSKQGTMGRMWATNAQNSGTNAIKL